MKVGFIGLGQMGAGMAANLLNAGHEVTVYNRTRAKAEPLVKGGAKEAATIADACRGDAVFTMLANDDVRENTLLDNLVTPDEHGRVPDMEDILATADAHGQPDVSYKGGMPGFVRILDDRTLAFPDYDGNGMFKSLGNVLVNAKVGLLFVDFEHPNRMRVSGTASVSTDDPLLGEFSGAQMIVRVRAERIFPNCPRYIHRMQLVEHSVYAPRPKQKPPEPGWKRMDVFRDALPRPRDTRSG